MKKLVIAYILLVPVLVVVDALHFTAVQSVVGSHHRLAAASEIMRETETLAGAMQQARAAVAAFVADRPGATLAPYQDAAKQVAGSARHLVELARGDQAEEARAAKIDSAVSKVLEVWQQAVDFHVKSGAKPEKQAGFAEQADREAGNIQPLLTEMRTYESGRLPGFSAAAQAAVDRVGVLTPFAAVLSIWMVLVAALLLYRDSTRRAWKGTERRIHSRIFETLPFGVCLVDEHGLISLTNPAQEALFNYPPGELIGRHLTILHKAPREDGEGLFEQAMQALSEHGQWRGEFPARTKSGAEFNCLCQAVSLDLAGKPHHVFLLASQKPPAAE